MPLSQCGLKSLWLSVLCFPPEGTGLQVLLVLPWSPLHARNPACISLLDSYLVHAS